MHTARNSMRFTDRNRDIVRDSRPHWNPETQRVRAFPSGRDSS